VAEREQAVLRLCAGAFAARGLSPLSAWLPSARLPFSVQCSHARPGCPPWHLQLMTAAPRPWLTRTRAAHAGGPAPARWRAPHRTAKTPARAARAHALLRAQVRCIPDVVELGDDDLDRLALKIPPLKVARPRRRRAAGAHGAVSVFRRGLTHARAVVGADAAAPAASRGRQGVNEPRAGSCGFRASDAARVRPSPQSASRRLRGPQRARRAARAL
jgi:hypothetical protein